MKLFKEIKKGFTLVELVSVISVIAILVGASIGIYFGVTETAKKSNDLSVITQMNKALKVDEVANGAPIAPSGALNVLRNYGFDVTKMTPFQDGAYYLWDSEENQMVLLTKDHVVDAPADVKMRSNKIDYYSFVGNTEERHDEQGYSYFLKDNYLGDNNFSTSVDTGTNTIDVNLTTNESISLNLFTKGGFITVDAPNADIDHYGSANVIDIKAIDDESYHIKGEVHMFVTIETGRVVVESTAIVNEIDVRGATSLVDVKMGATVDKIILRDERSNINLSDNANIKTIVAQTNNILNLRNQYSKTRSNSRDVQAIVEVDSYSKLTEALAAGNKYIVLKSDIDVDTTGINNSNHTEKVLNLYPGVTIDGYYEGNIHSISAKYKLSGKYNGNNMQYSPRVMNVYTSDENNSPVNIKNLHVNGDFENKGVKRGIQIADGGSNKDAVSSLDLNIYNSFVEAELYTFNIGGSLQNDNININIEDTNLKAWNAFTMYSNHTDISINNGSLECPNNNTGINNSNGIFFVAGEDNIFNISNSHLKTSKKYSDVKQYIACFITTGTFKAKNNVLNIARSTVDYTSDQETYLDEVGSNIVTVNGKIQEKFSSLN